MRSLLWLILGAVAAWLLTALPMALLAKDPAQRERILVYSGSALIICLVPTGLTLLLSTVLSRQPQDQWMVVVGGTGIRMFVTIAASVALYMGFEYFRKEPEVLNPFAPAARPIVGQYWLWILGAYLVTLALETVLVLRAGPTQQANLELTAPTGVRE